jgi:aspartyl-tRNA(Asn)/glutamyl-tRNA(Gln) amidotransferase subunit C
MSTKETNSETLSLDEVNRIARLSNLVINEEDAKKLTHQLNDILGYVQQLSRLETKNIEPMSHAQSSSNIYREDSAANTLTTEEALENAPDRSGNFFRTPLIVEG